MDDVAGLLSITQMSSKVLIALALGNLPVYFVLGWLWFGSWEDFLECLKFWLTPDIFSWFYGEGVDDWWAETKLGFWLFSCVCCVVVEAYLIHRFGQ